MLDPSKKEKRKGIIGTIFFHSFLLFIFLFMGLNYQDPPPAEEGISINFGFNDSGLGEIEPENTEEIAEIEEDKVIEKQIEENEEIITQSIEENPAIKVLEKKKEPIQNQEAKEEIVEEKKPEINKKAIYTGKKKNTTSTEGKENKKSNKGNENGDLNSQIYNGGGIGENGNAYQLGGRKAIKKPKPKGNQIEGKVVVMITVNRLGNVIYAVAGAKGSTTYNKELLERAKKAALATKFDTKRNAPENQQGRIIYDFRLN
ncbi:MAG: energy transducer TonB [Flavobacteriales bacterium]|nr:energy transducer TonB [Flavobacteriales bacterium]|tara:strand:+ start:943 stop:1719 length:777 start_codon:yes stop_codon:yes gene_type:complete